MRSYKPKKFLYWSSWWTCSFIFHVWFPTQLNFHMLIFPHVGRIDWFFRWDFLTWIILFPHDHILYSHHHVHFQRLTCWNALWHIFPQIIHIIICEKSKIIMWRVFVIWCHWLCSTVFIRMKRSLEVQVVQIQVELYLNL